LVIARWQGVDADSLRRIIDWHLGLLLAKCMILEASWNGAVLLRVSGLHGACHCHDFLAPAMLKTSAAGLFMQDRLLQQPVGAVVFTTKVVTTARVTGSAGTCLQAYDFARRPLRGSCAGHAWHWGTLCYYLDMLPSGQALPHIAAATQTQPQLSMLAPIT
jgi:hypothetical protein